MEGYNGTASSVRGWRGENDEYSPTSTYETMNEEAWRGLEIQNTASSSLYQVDMMVTAS